MHKIAEDAETGGGKPKYAEKCFHIPVTAGFKLFYRMSAFWSFMVITGRKTNKQTLQCN